MLDCQYAVCYILLMDDKKQLDADRAAAAPQWFSELKQELAQKSKRELVRMLAETLVMFSNTRKELEDAKNTRPSQDPQDSAVLNQQGHQENQEELPDEPA